MNAQENKQMVMEAYRLFQRGEIAQLLERYHDDAEWIGPESDLVPFSGNFHGKQGIAQFFGKLNAAAQALQFEPARFIAEGDQVVAMGNSTWLARATGRSYESPWVHVFTIRDGKVSRFQHYSDTAAADKAFNPAQPGMSASAAPLHH